MDELAAKHVLLDFEIVTLIALALGVILYSMARRRRKSEALDLHDPNRFDGFDLALVFFPALLFLVNPAAELAVASGDLVSMKPEPENQNQIRDMFVHLGFMAFVGLMTYGINEWVRGRSLTKAFGLRRLTIPVIVMYSILGGVASLLICLVMLGAASEALMNSLFGELQAQEPVRTFQASESDFHLVLSIVTACVAAPIVEEFLFRGYMYGVVKHFTNPLFAAVITGALFAVVHGNLPALLPLWGFAIVLSATYEVTKCLWVPVGIHALFNIANIVLMMRADGVS